VVDLIDLYYKNSSTPVTAADLRAILRATRAFTASNPLEVGSAAARNTLQDKERIRPPKRKWTRLQASAKADIVARYEAGETSTALAAEYGVAKSTVLNLLRSAGVAVRRQPLTPQQVSEAARLYDSGLSLSQVAERLSVNQETMRMALKSAGIALRPPTGA